MAPGQHAPSTVIQNRIQPYVGVIGNPDLRKGTTAARANAIGFDEVFEDAPPHPANPNTISFAQAEQSAGRSPPPYVETSDDTPPQPRVDEFGHRRLRGEMGSGDTFNTTNTTGFVGSGSSLAQMGIRANISDHYSGAGGSGSSLAQMGIRANLSDRYLGGSVGNRTEGDEPEL